MSSAARIDRLEWSGDGTAGSVLVLPGANGGIFQSSLYWPTVALVEAGWEILVAQWGDEPVVEQVARTAAEGLARLATAPNALVLGKSLGSVAIAEVDRAGTPAVWLTPLTDRAPVAAAIEAGTAPTLLVGGTADPSWHRPSHRADLRVLEIEGANHGLLIPDDWRRSLDRLAEVVETVTAFARESGAP
jgi:hypothetical protein